jgi:hypothetical protein
MGPGFSTEAIVMVWRGPNGTHPTGMARPGRLDLAGALSFQYKCGVGPECPGLEIGGQVSRVAGQELTSEQLA